MEIDMSRIFGTRADVINVIKNATFVIAGSVILAFGVGVFIVPFELVTGGVSGLAIILASVITFEFVTVDFCVTVLTWLLFFIGLIFLGKSFALKTLISSIVYPLALSLCMKMTSPDFLGGLFDIAGSYPQGGTAVETIFAVFGGVLIGIGCALTFRGGGSTGGLDILALMLSKYVKKAKSSVTVFIFDATVVVVGLFVMKDIIHCLLGVTSAFVVAIVIDKVFLGASKAFIAHIVSDKYVEINAAIIERLDRTSTIITSRGGYSGADKYMIMVSFTMPQYATFMAIIKSIDPDAFVTVHRAHEIDGEGWTKYDIKTKK